MKELIVQDRSHYSRIKHSKTSNDEEQTQFFLKNEENLPVIIWPKKEEYFPANNTDWFIILTTTKLRNNFWINGQKIFGLDSIYKLTKYK